MHIFTIIFCGACACLRVRLLDTGFSRYSIHTFIYIYISIHREREREKSLTHSSGYDIPDAAHFFMQNHSGYYYLPFVVFMDASLWTA